VVAGIPSYTAIRANVHAMARYAALCQAAQIVPIVEPEVLMDGDHGIDRCAEVTEWVLKTQFEELYYHRVALEGMDDEPEPGEVTYAEQRHAGLRHLALHDVSFEHGPCDGRPQRETRPDGPFAFFLIGLDTRRRQHAPSRSELRLGGCSLRLGFLHLAARDDPLGHELALPLESAAREPSTRRSRTSFQLVVP